MQNASTAFTKTDLARYPFLKKTGQYVKELDLDIADLKLSQNLFFIRTALIDGFFQNP